MIYNNNRLNIVYDITYEIINKTMILRMTSYMMEIFVFLALYDIVKKL